MWKNHFEFTFFEGDDLYLSLGKIEYLISLYKKCSYFDVLGSSDFESDEQWLYLKTLDLPIKIKLKRLEKEGINKCLKKIKKAVIISIKSNKSIVSYTLEEEE